MKLLTFQAKRFAWAPYEKTVDDAPDAAGPDALDACVVAFLHVEANDGGERRGQVFRHTLKHLKWVAGKRGLKAVVLHSFTHLGGDTAPAPVAAAFLKELGERLQATGYVVKATPFGYFCSWDLSVHGESLAKVFKDIS